MLVRSPYSSSCLRVHLTTRDRHHQITVCGTGLERVGRPYNTEDCAKSDFPILFGTSACPLQGPGVQAKLLNTIPGIRIHLVLRSTRPDQAFFGVINDNLTFGDIVKLYHQYRYN